MEGPTRLHQMAVARSEAVARRDAALGTLVARAGEPLPQISEAGLPRPLTAAPYLIGQAVVDATLAEAVVRLANEVDGLREQLAAQQAPMGARDGGNTR